MIELRLDYDGDDPEVMAKAISGLRQVYDSLVKQGQPVKVTSPFFVAHYDPKGIKLKVGG